MCLNVDFFVSICLRFFQLLKLVGVVAFANFRKISATMSLNNFLPSLSLSSFCKIRKTGKLDLLLEYHSSLKLYILCLFFAFFFKFIYLCCPDLVIYIVLASNSLILLLNPSTKYFVLVIFHF